MPDLGIDWAIVATAGVTFLWGLVRHFRPNWATQMRQLERQAHDVFDAVEGLAIQFKWGPAEKLSQYRKRLFARAKRLGLPTSTRAVDMAVDWAEQWAAEMKAKLKAEVDKIEAALSRSDVLWARVEEIDRRLNRRDAEPAAESVP